MPLAALPDHLAPLDIQGGIEAGQSVALVVVRLPGRQPFSQGQERLRAIQGLDLGLLVETDDGGMLGGVQVETDHVADLLLGPRVGAELERLDPVRFQPVLLPDPMHRAVRQTSLIRELPRTPMGEASRRRLERHRHDLGDLAPGDLPRA
jgi:hypothetical protein